MKCARESCANAARERSKYCSDNCRMRVADAAWRARQEAPVAPIHVRTHKGHPGRAYLAEAEQGGKHLYRYGATEVEARARMQEALRG